MMFYPIGNLSFVWHYSCLTVCHVISVTYKVEGLLHMIIMHRKLHYFALISKLLCWLIGWETNVSFSHNISCVDYVDFIKLVKNLQRCLFKCRWPAYFLYQLLLMIACSFIYASWFLSFPTVLLGSKHFLICPNYI